MPGFDEDHLHGVVVGFGVLLLLTIDGKEEECQKLIAFNKTVGLPAKLSEVGVTVEEVAKCAPFMVKDEDLEHYPDVYKRQHQLRLQNWNEMLHQINSAPCLTCLLYTSWSCILHRRNVKMP